MENRSLEISLPESQQSAPEGRGEHFKRRALSIAAIVCGLLTFCFAGVILREGKASDIILRQRINPNIATAESLARLPGIGAAKAGAIVSYRQQFQNENAGQPAFQNINDLQKVRGIGLKTVQNIYKFLDFK